jgi:hypothetical protein
MSSGTELSPVVFGQHFQLILNLDFFFCGCLKHNVYNRNPQIEELNENNHREIANIPAEQLRR